MRKNGAGGSRPGSGRKPGTGVTNKINNAVKKFMDELLQDEEIKNRAFDELKQASFFDGWIYIIKDNNTSHYKVGVTQRENPNSRFSLYRSHFMEISLIYIDKVNNVFELEDLLHGMFKRVSTGDWFDFSDKDIVNIITKISSFKYPAQHLYLNQDKEN